MSTYRRQYHITQDMDAETLQIETDEAIERLRRIRGTILRKLPLPYNPDNPEYRRLAETLTKINRLNLEIGY